MWPISDEYLKAIRYRPTFARWWQPWRRCPARSMYARRRCQLTRPHYGRHAWRAGFDVRYFDTATEGTP
jgi:hypothetical protein